jgi:hypothetical protein
VRQIQNANPPDASTGSELRFSVRIDGVRIDGVGASFFGFSTLNGTSALKRFDSGSMFYDS